MPFKKPLKIHICGNCVNFGISLAKIHQRKSYKSQKHQIDTGYARMDDMKRPSPVQ